MSEDPSWMPNREREGSAPAEAERERRRQLGCAGELSRSASPSVLPNNYPIVSLRQQLALIKQMEQPSPSGSTDGASVDGVAVGAATASGSLTPAGKKKIPKIHKKNDRGETPLHVAARKGDERQCVELLDAGAEVNCADYAGWTPLHEATAHGRWTTADMLLKRGANVNAASIDEETPLHDAAYNANAPLVWLLLSHGADKEKKNKKGERAMDICDEESRAYALLQSGELPAHCPDESPEGSPAPSSRKASPPHAAPVKVTEKPASLPPPPPAAAAALVDEPHLPTSVPISISVASPARWSTPPETMPVVVPSPRQSPATRPSPRPSPRKTPSISPREKETAQPAERAPPAVPVPVETADESADREERGESPLPMRVEADIDTSPEMDPEAEPPMDDPTLSPTKEQPAEQVEHTAQKEEEEKDTDRTLDETDPMIMQEAEVEKEDKEKSQEQDEPMEEEDEAPLEIDEGEEEADSPALQVAEEEEMEQDKPEEEQEEEAEKDEDEESVEMGAPVVEQEKEKPAAVWKQHVLEKKAESVPPPDDSHAFDFAEEDDESKSARGRSEERTEPRRGRGRGRGRGRPAGHSSSGSATPQYHGGATEKKKGRTRRRGSWRAAGPSKDEQAAPTASEDVYEFRSSPESEGEDGEPTGPSNKRIRLTAAATADTPNRAESNHSGELDREEPDDVDDDDTKMSSSTGPAKKVPPITLRLYGHQKTPSEDDGNDDAASNSLLNVTASYKESSAPPGMSSNSSVSGRRGGVGRGRFGKKGSGGDGDDHARVTRSRVRQGGKQLDDDQQLPRKKGRRPVGDVASMGEMDDQEAEGSVPPEPREHRAPPTFEGETTAQQLLLVNSYAGVIGLKDLIERRWRATVESTPRSQNLPEKHTEYLVCTRDYPLRGECDEDDKPPQPPATVVPVMFDVWRKQEQKRVELRTKQRVARERARMMLEKERIRLERREINDAPAISAIQIIKEQSILNPLYLEEPQPRPPPLSRDAFAKKADEMKTDLFQRQKLDAGGLVAMQRSEWEWESRRRGVEFNKAILAQHIVPIDVVAISVEF